MYGDDQFGGDQFGGGGFDAGGGFGGGGGSQFAAAVPMQVGGSQGGNNRSNQEAGVDRPSSASSYDAGAAESPSRASPSRPGPPSVTTQSTWEDGASSHVPSPSEVRQRARARKGPRRRRHPPRHERHVGDRAEKFAECRPAEAEAEADAHFSVDVAPNREL